MQRRYDREFIRDESKYIPNIVLRYILTAKGNNLVEKGLCVTHAAFGSLDDVAETTVINFRSLVLSPAHWHRKLAATGTRHCTLGRRRCFAIWQWLVRRQPATTTGQLSLSICW